LPPKFPVGPACRPHSQALEQDRRAGRPKGHDAARKARLEGPGAVPESGEGCRPGSFPDLSLSVIKLLGNGEYVVRTPGEDGAGHFGLAVKDYNHSTAPNRRYPDIITQRLIKAALSGVSPPYKADELEALAAHCTEQEDDANKIERQVRKSAAVLLLESRIGQQFDAIVTGATDHGTWVRILDPPVEGKLDSGFEGLDVGDRLRVQLISTDLERGFIDFKKAGNNDKFHNSHKRGKKNHKRGI